MAAKLISPYNAKKTIMDPEDTLFATFDPMTDPDGELFGDADKVRDEVDMDQDVWSALTLRI